MATPSSVKIQASELVALTHQVKDQLAETLDLTQYQPLCDLLKSELTDLHLNHASVADQLSQETQDEAGLLVNIDLAKTWQIKLLERINSLKQQPTATVTSKKRHAKLPEIKLMNFSGNFIEWEIFWEFIQRQCRLERRSRTMSQTLISIAKSRGRASRNGFRFVTHR